LKDETALLSLLIILLLYFSYLGISKHKAMKFTSSITVNQPLEKTVSIWKNPDNFTHWQEGFISKELLSGTTGEVGAVSLIKLDFKKEVMELTETIQLANLPNEFKVLIEHKRVIPCIPNSRL